MILTDVADLQLEHSYQFPTPAAIFPARDEEGGMTSSEQRGDLMKLDVIAFQGSSNLPLWVAIDRGLFSARGSRSRFTPPTAPSRRCST